MRKSLAVSVVVSLTLLLKGLIPDICFATGELEAPRYTGNRISLDLQHADIGDVLRLIADVSGLNIITSSGVKGTVTTRMVDVPWEQALEVILKLHGLTQERHGNVILIAPLRQVIERREEHLRAQQEQAQAETTITRVVPIKYRDAAELKTTLEKHLAACATISVDARTNTLIIVGTPSCLQLNR